MGFLSTCDLLHPIHLKPIDQLREDERDNHLEFPPSAGVTRGWRLASTSPRHVFLKARDVPGAFQRLQQRGLLAEEDFALVTYTNEGEESVPPPMPLTEAEKSYLLCLFILVESLPLTFSPPAGMLGRLAEGLSLSLRAAATRKAYQALQQLYPPSAWYPDPEPPAVPEPELIEALEHAIRTEMPIDVWYQAAGRGEPEHRHLTPLLVEQRGPRFYLLAYCHQRRANRTFRLDRMALLDGPPFDGE